MFDTVYVDGDLLLYSLGFATQRNIYHIYVEGQLAWIDSDKRKINKIFKDIDYDYEKYVYVQPLLSAIQTYKAIINGHIKRFNTKDIRVVLTGKNNFREKVATTRPYKGTRSKDKPYNYAGLKEFMIKNGAIVTEGEEADDYISYKTYNRIYSIAVTDDKDAMNTPSYIYRKEEIIRVTEEDADRNFWSQVITGDSTDNIPGLPGVGKAALPRIYEGCVSYQDYECAAGVAYASHPGIDDPEEYLREQGTLLWMRRHPEEMWDLGYYV